MAAGRACRRLAGALLLVLLSAQPADAARAYVRGRSAAAAPPTKGVTPVDKVVELLTKLRAQVEADGKKEAEQYDKYACFCKEQADEKLYAIEKSTKLIGDLEAEILDLGGAIAALGQDIGVLAGKIVRLQTDIAKAVATREGEHKIYLEKEADIKAAIDAVERAIAALKDSKSELSGKVELEAASPSPELMQVVKVLQKTMKQPGQAYEYVYHSNDIIATLEGLLLTFKETKERLYIEEFEANSAFEKDKLAKANEKAFAEKEKLAKEKLVAAKTERKEEADAEKTEEEKDKAADEDFMRTLKDSCETKATEWDERSKTRAGELAAISQAMEALTTGVVPNWAANRMLVGFQKHQEVKHPASFLQLEGEDHREAQAKKVLELLQRASRDLSSPILSVAAVRVKAAEDHFVKVRSIIKDIISKLEAQAAAEATTKSFCDTNMEAAISSRDAKQEEVESLTATITEKEALKKQLTGEIAMLAAQIADNLKALKEATELRADEKADNLGVMKQATIGKEAVEFALSVLKKFYEQGALLQVRSGYTPYKATDSDRAGSTLGDLAPKVWDSDYKGRQQASSSIIGMLEVILEDFTRTDTTVGAQETSQQQDFEAFETAITTDTDTKETTKSGKETEVSNLEDELIGLMDTKKDAEAAHAQALSELEQLRKMCVEGEETYEERVAKREKEIEALKQAHDILENWKS